MGKVVVAIAMAVVLLILMSGLYTLWKGGDTARKYSNKLMQLRVLAQFIAILIIMLVLYISSQH